MKMGTFVQAQFLESEFGPKLPNCDNKMLIISSKQTLHCKIFWLCRYTFSYLLCHALNLINVIVNINLLNTFFDGRFTEFGTRLTWFKICAYMYSSHYFFCRWLASSETHSVLPDVFPTVSNHFLSNNWNLHYLKMLPFAQMTGCTWQQFGSGGHPEVLGFPFLHQFMTISARKLNQKFLDAMQ